MFTHPPTTEYSDPDLFFPLTVIMEDEPMHHAPYYFCPDDPTCLCHEDPGLITTVAREVEQGLLTAQEATRIVQGTQIITQGGSR